MHQANEFNCYLNAVFLIEMDRLRASAGAADDQSRQRYCSKQWGRQPLHDYPAIGFAKGSTGGKYSQMVIRTNERLIDWQATCDCGYWQRADGMGTTPHPFPRTFSRCIGVTLLARCSDFTATSTLHGG